ncbi:MAG: trypsin-like serine protease [Dactylosporangium sp.]|nr:S1 family peptidase [Dactylosporangium sp.]NNJ60144.1 trypsin-like serine protease [Dactylosporangium sp.]
MLIQPVYWSIFVVDVEGSGKRTNPEKLRMRDDLYGALMVAFARAGIPWDDCPAEDRGDGAYVLIPAHVPKPVLAGALVPALDAILAEPRASGQWPRLRLSLHAGEVTQDQEGSSGRDVDLAFALADAEPVRQALREDLTARLVLVVSETFFSAITHSGHPGLREGDFRPTPISTKQAAEPAWIRGPGTPVMPAPLIGDLAWQVRIRLPSGPVCGPGILATEQFVLTCAHLIPGGRESRHGVAVDFAGAPAGSASQLAEVDTWVARTPGGVDLAVLRLNAPVPLGAQPARVARLGQPSPGRRVTVCAAIPWPAEVVGPDGVAYETVRLRHSGDGEIQTGTTTRRCCAADCRPGTAVADDTSGHVIGMVVDSEERTDGTCPVIIPVDALVQRWAPLGSLLPAQHPRADPHPPATPHLSTPRPAGTRPVTGVLRFALEVADLPTLRTGAGRDQVIGQLRPDIAALVPRHTERRFDVLSLVRTCLDYPGGLDEMLAVLQTLEGDSVQLRRIMELRANLEDS